MSKAKRYTPDDSQTNNFKIGLKGFLLFIMPVPVLVAAVISLVGGNFWATVINGTAFAGFMLAAVIARHGFKVEQLYHSKKLALAPTTPFKTVSALILSITTGLTAFLATDNYGIFSSILIGGATLLAYYFWYGLDPRRDKTGNIGLGVTAEEVFEETRDHSDLAMKIDDSFQAALRNYGTFMANFEGGYINQRNRVLGIG